MAKNPSKAQATKVLAAVKAKWAAYEDDGYPPKLLEDFDGRKWTIVWEEGPYQWSYSPIDEVTLDEELTALANDFGGTGPVYTRAVALPPGVWVEPINHYSVGIYLLEAS